MFSFNKNIRNENINQFLHVVQRFLLKYVKMITYKTSQIIE